ncbi:conserved hypothetical protein [delta proteobacterium NaphS2]|nr:conserved hypothetical protein [delta proteobacterium NaphS2]
MDAVFLIVSMVVLKDRESAFSGQGKLNAIDMSFVFFVDLKA